MKKILLSLICILLICGSAFAQEKAWRYKSHATDCTALTSGKESDLCYQRNTQEMYKCVPASGDCDTPSEWILVSGGLSGQTIDYVPKANSATTLIPSAIIDVAGNVGVGNITPAEKLDVFGNVKAYSFISNSGAGSFTSSNADGFGFDTDNDAVNEIFMSTTGRIGINNDTPDASLRILGEGDTSGTTALKITNSTPTTMFSINNAGATTIGDGTLSGAVTINNSNAGPLIINSTQAYTSNGNIIQFRSNPTANGPPVAGNALASFWFQACSDTATCKNVTGADITAKATATWTPYDDSFTSLNFSTAAGTTTRVLRLIINSDGKIGVGPSTTPGALLDINNATASDLRFSRTDTTATANDRIGKIEFYNNDTELTTQNIYADIEVQATSTVSTDAAAGHMIFRTTGAGAGGSPIEAMRITSAQVIDLANPLGFTEGGTGLATANDDTLLVSSGSAWQAKAIPDCDDTGGNHLNYDTATNALSCGTSGGGGGGTWGSITGTLSAQTDLNTEFGLKAPLDSPTFTTFLKLPNSANPTIDAAGKIAIDTSATTGSAIRFYGDATYTLPAYQRMSFTIEATTASSDYEIGSFPANITIRAIRVFQVGATNVVGGLQECDANGASCSAVDSDITATTTTATDDGSLTNPTIDANDQLQWLTSSVSGTNTRTVVTIYYTYDAVN